MPKVTVVVKRKDTIRGNEFIPRQKAIVQSIRQIKEIDDFHVNRGQMYGVVAEEIVQRSIPIVRRGKRIDLIEENNDAMQIDQTIEMKYQPDQLIESFPVAQDDNRVLFIGLTTLEWMSQSLRTEERLIETIPLVVEGRFDLNGRFSLRWQIDLLHETKGH